MWYCHPDKTFPRSQLFRYLWSFSICHLLCVLFTSFTSHIHILHSQLCCEPGLCQGSSHSLAAEISAHSFPLPFICTHDDGQKRRDLHSILSPAWSLTADYTPFNFTETQWTQRLTLSILCFSFRVQLSRQKSAFRISLLPVIAIK